MTEDEAKTKWCPFVRVSATNDESEISDAVAINRWPVDHNDQRNPFGDHNACIGSACMAWRWSWDALVLQSTTDGHCGLAGRP